MSHSCVIGDTISCDAPYSERDKLQWQVFFCDAPHLLGLLWIAIGHFLKKEVVVAATVCDITENTVLQWYCYTCLAMGGGLRSGR